jgi:hypothetical protein
MDWLRTWRPPWTDLARRLDEWNHPYELAEGGYPDSHWGARYPWLCALLDRLTNYWCHD